MVKKMLVQSDLQKLINTLIDQNLAAISINGNNIFVHMVEDASHLTFSALIWQGVNFVPLSIREIVSHKPPFPNFLANTRVVIDEEKCQVFLNYSQLLEELSHHEMGELLEEFGIMTARWKEYINDLDQRDLIHIPVR